MKQYPLYLGIMLYAFTVYVQAIKLCKVDRACIGFYFHHVFFFFLSKVSGHVHTRSHRQGAACQYRYKQSSERKCFHDDNLYREQDTSVCCGKTWKLQVSVQINGD